MPQRQFEIQFADGETLVVDNLDQAEAVVTERTTLLGVPADLLPAEIWAIEPDWPAGFRGVIEA